MRYDILLASIEPVRKGFDIVSWAGWNWFLLLANIGLTLYGLHCVRKVHKSNAEVKKLIFYAKSNKAFKMLIVRTVLTMGETTVNAYGDCEG